MSILHPVPPFQTKEEYAYHVLREAILGGRMTPGERLVMDHLSKEMGISPIPLRSALQRLQTEGLVEITPHSSAVVSMVSPDEIGEIFLLLEALEALAFRAAAERVTPADLEELSRLVDSMEVANASIDSDDLSGEAVERWAETNDRFHRAVAALSGMKLLAELTGRALDQWTRLRRSFRATFATRIPQAQADHHRMIALLQRSNGDALAALAAEHNRSARRAYLDSIHTHPLEEPNHD